MAWANLLTGVIPGMVSSASAATETLIDGDVVGYAWIEHMVNEH